ncbi:thiamine diphosphokinase [Marivita sp. S6314]|uniref:thiamine diphosphokinase n=1 Tax=Marivita sp. S6314 TaxID=2926406 RepID=UPI001FF3FD25|nr:thiamine diphosphokinase [Marivita sp. S6314]MCK0149017.1 thiamine diphosphokinase [Marivita sp. S6314]
MNTAIVFSDEPVLLVGGAIGDNAQLSELLNEFRTVVAADSGADWLMQVGRVPDALIGDLDSVSDATRAAIPADRVHHIAEQDSTDFDKALRSISAPLVVGIGFLGGQVDHLLAAMTVLARFPHRAILLVGQDDVVLHLPPRIELDLAPETRVSLFPMRAVTGRSTGLRWPIDGLRFSPDRRVGTSNKADGPVTLRMDGAGMLLILPVQERAQLATALVQADGLWPAL